MGRRRNELWGVENYQWQAQPVDFVDDSHVESDGEGVTRLVVVKQSAKVADVLDEAMPRV
jgi:hypothetical protein